MAMVLMLWRNSNDKFKNALVCLCSNFPASFSGEVQTCGLKLGWVTAGNMSLERRRISIQTAAGDLQLSTCGPEPAYF